MNKTPEKVKKVTSTKSPKAAKSGPSAKTFDLSGKSLGTTSLPTATFGQKPNKKLLAQALRVYKHNSEQKTANTKTRAQVRGGGRKPWRQKGTGNARAGSRRSPLWVGGGITFGPKPSDKKMDLPKKMRQKALVYALSQKSDSGQIFVISNLEAAEAKTKVIASLLKKLEVNGETLLVIAKDSKLKGEKVKLAARNIPKVFLDSPENLNAFVVNKMKKIVLSKDSVKDFK